MTATIAVLPGDGVGPEVVGEAVRVLEAVSRRSGRVFHLTSAHIGGVAIDLTGTPLPEETALLCKRADAVLLGAVGGPKWDGVSSAVRPEQGLLGLRRALGVYANLRPIVVWPELRDASPIRTERLIGVDIVFVRELIGGIYFGAKRRVALEDGDELAADVCEYTTSAIERVVRVAAGVARERRAKLTSVDKANVLETSRLWREVTSRVVREEFADVALEHMLVDTCAMRLLQSPASFDVIVTDNMFGDILTDEASMLAGSMGLLPSASLGECIGGHRRGLYEPIHGSAPDIAGNGVANPIGAILSAALLLRHSLGLSEEAGVVERTVRKAVADGFGTPDIVGANRKGCSTSDFGDLIVERVMAEPSSQLRTAATRAGVSGATAGPWSRG